MAGAFMAGTARLVRRRPSIKSLLRATAVGSRLNFLVLFSVLALLGVVGLALAVSSLVTNEIRRESLNHATGSALLLARASFEPHIQDRRLTAEEVYDADLAARGAAQVDQLRSVLVLNTQHRVLYSSDHRLIGQPAPVDVELRAALAGRTQTEVAGAGSTERVEVYVPLRVGGRVFAALAMQSAYTPVRQEIDHRTQRIKMVIFGAAGLLYLLLLPFLARAARLLRAEHSADHVALVRDLRRAIDNGELHLHYQPLMNLRTRRVESVEALVRWQHPKRGPVAPDQFIPLLEQTELMWDFSLHIADMALCQCRRWIETGLSVQVAINLTSTNIRDKRLPGALRGLLEKWDVPPQLLGVEITEGAIMQRTDEAITTLRQLSQAGITVSIDDFGTGYSSLGRVRDLPVQWLKIDRSFIVEMNATGDQTLVRAIIDLSHNLALRVVAEGIEDHATWDVLHKLDCDAVQGYLLTRPLPAEELQKWLHANTNLPTANPQPRKLARV